MNVSIYNCALNIKKKKEEKKIVNVLPSFLCVSILEDLRSIKKEVRERERKKKSLGDDLPKCVAEERRWRGPSQGCVSPCGASGAQRTPQCGAPRLLRPGSVPRRWRRERRSGAARRWGWRRKFGGFVWSRRRGRAAESRRVKTIIVIVRLIKRIRKRKRVRVGASRPCNRFLLLQT